MKCMKSCCCSLKTGCYAVTFYTLVTVVLTFMLSHVFRGRQEYAPWTRFMDIGFTLALLIGTMMLYKGLNNNCVPLIAGWLTIFLVRVSYTIGLLFFEIYILVRVLTGTLSLSIFFRHELPTAILVSCGCATFDIAAIVIVVSFLRKLSDTKPPALSDATVSAGQSPAPRDLPMDLP
ncbi:uncharacterized protein LOC129585563 [Paramacrobiotus metropolitanus]|uniref:uncharacterized protein LOC129585563 n=1 Tax=Paramacrobiotus metropolitanus TaxID=2943436 RepID=UPI00244628F8|nr:uncharacterized protein LOC129585563 [Paramacrobiotus metropolitanus]